MQNEGPVFDSDRVRRLTQAFDLVLERLRIDAADHDVRKRLARTLVKVARFRAEDATPEVLADATIEQARAASAPRDRLAPWLETVRRSPPPVGTWRLVERLRVRGSVKPVVLD